MSEILEYTNISSVLNPPGPRFPKETTEVLSLKPGQYWVDREHRCSGGSLSSCYTSNNIRNECKKAWGSGQITVRHTPRGLNRFRESGPLFVFRKHKD